MKLAGLQTFRLLKCLIKYLNKQLKFRQALIYSLCSAALAYVLIVGWVPVAFAQLPLPSSVAQNAGQLPPNVTRIGTVETAPVYFENRELFQVASAAVWNRADPGDQILVEVRAEQITANLQRIIASDETWKSSPIQAAKTTFDPETLQVKITNINGQTVLQAEDQNRSQPQDLLTVTELDAKFYGLTVQELAQQRQQQLQQILVSALQARSPDAMLRHLQKAAQIIAITAGISLLLYLLQRPMRHREQSLKARQAEVDANASTSHPESATTHRFHFLDHLRARFSLERRHSLNALLRWLLLWAQASIWIVGITQILSIFPQTQAFAERVWATPIALVLVIFATGALNRLGDVVINRFSRALEDNELFTFEDVQRRCLRISTLIRVTKGVKTFCVIVFGLVWALNIFGVPISSVLTIGAVIALAVSLASQSLIKDLVNGILILCEDQYGIGDFIAVGTAMGLVENMNLRITQLRNAEGRLITIPNGLISQVDNLTRVWSRVDFTIEVAYDANLKHALTVLNQVSQQFYEHPDWQPLLIKTPEVLGVDRLSHAGSLIRVWLQTQPLQQWKVGREFRLRVWTAFTEQGIGIGVPQQVFRYQPKITTDLEHGDALLAPRTTRSAPQTPAQINFEP